MVKYLISGNKSGLGKYLFDNLPNSVGFGRGQQHIVQHCDNIIHCAFNKTNDITNHYQYLEDNIFLTKNLLNCYNKKFIYISTIDVYNQNPTMYSLFKQFSESIVLNHPNTLVLRCSMMLGPTMKPNHVTKLKNNSKKIGLSGESTFNYILMEDIYNFIINEDLSQYNGIIDFISNSNTKLSEVKKYFNSNTKLGDYKYESLNLENTNPIHILNSKYNKSSIDNLKTYFT
tara:strand:+ start:2505 stop:3194 length:690 start_codon:yes stop_codon:yes gene_type:complete